MSLRRMIGGKGIEMRAAYTLRQCMGVMDIVHSTRSQSSRHAACLFLLPRGMSVIPPKRMPVSDLICMHRRNACAQQRAELAKLLSVLAFSRSDIAEVT
ncbi:hypothetical protein C8J57DRAFT_1516517 [Mycena rebaudengoi]|nr:hypothetical protein C8J57DRAFT_1516517 [Mycena rebaudengoi]